MTGAAGAGCCKASFFLIMISQSNCFSCSSVISLESTSLLMKFILIQTTNYVFSIQQIVKYTCMHT